MSFQFGCRRRDTGLIFTDFSWILSSFRTAQIDWLSHIIAWSLEGTLWLTQGMECLQWGWFPYLYSLNWTHVLIATSKNIEDNPIEPFSGPDLQFLPGLPPQQLPLARTLLYTHAPCNPGVLTASNFQLLPLLVNLLNRLHKGLR